MEGLYINLDDCKHRKIRIERQISKLGWAVKRFSAVRRDFGAIGCTLSHIKCLEKLYELGTPYVCILEDDATFKNISLAKRIVSKIINGTFPLAFDVLLLGTAFAKGVKTSQENFLQIKSSQSTTGYIVRRDFIPVMLENYKEGLEMLVKTHKKKMYSIDKYWKKLYNVYTFIAHKSPICYQFEDFSQTANKYVHKSQTKDCVRLIINKPIEEDPHRVYVFQIGLSGSIFPELFQKSGYSIAGRKRVSRKISRRFNLKKSLIPDQKLHITYFYNTDLRLKVIEALYRNYPNSYFLLNTDGYDKIKEMKEYICQSRLLMYDSEDEIKLRDFFKGVLNFS